MQVNVMINKSIMEETTVYTTELITDNIPIAVGTLDKLKKPSASNLLSKILVLLYVEKKTAVYIMGDAKTKRKEIWTGSALWYRNNRWRGHTKINGSVKIPI